MTRIRLEAQGMEPRTAGHETIKAILPLLEDVLTTINEKSTGYEFAWQEQGWMGNLARIMSKCSRLRVMHWRNDRQELTVPVHEAAEAIEASEETARDLVALTLFFLANRKVGNRWGR